MKKIDFQKLVEGITKKVIKENNQEIINDYFEKFKQKMGKKTSVSTAIGWIEGANLDKNVEIELIDKVLDYLGYHK